MKNRNSNKQKSTNETLLKSHSSAVQRIARATKFPLQVPAEISPATADWTIQRSPSAKYPGAASFVLAAAD